MFFIGVLVRVFFIFGLQVGILSIGRLFVRLGAFYGFGWSIGFIFFQLCGNILGSRGVWGCFQGVLRFWGGCRGSVFLGFREGREQRGVFFLRFQLYVFDFYWVVGGGSSRNRCMDGLFRVMVSGKCRSGFIYQCCWLQEWFRLWKLLLFVLFIKFYLRDFLLSMWRVRSSVQLLLRSIRFFIFLFVFAFLVF